MARRVHFDCFEVDLDSGQLYKRGARVGLREKSFQVLALLVEHPGEVVTREELHRRLWHEDVVVDFDNNLNAAIARLRELLSDSAEHPHFIETLPKRGYRFLATVSETPPSRESSSVKRARLVVLPFVNLSGDSTQEYFSDAMTDDVITALANLAPDRLAVIARTTAMRYKGSHKDVARIGRELGVDYVVEGSVRGNHDRVTVNTQLIGTRDQAHLLARRFDAELRDVFALQNSIAQAIAAYIPLAAEDARITTAAGRAIKKPTEDVAAYNEYIQGRHDLATMSPEAFARARQHLEAAVARDPRFALAYDSLAEVYWCLGYLGFMRPVDAFSTGVLHAVRALEIDPTLAETHALLAQYHKQLHYDWPEVEREMARALALNPNSPLVRVRYAFNQLMPQGRLQEAVTELELALDLDPLNAYYRAALAITLAYWRCFDRAWTEAHRLLELDPKAYWGHYALAVCYRERGLHHEAIASCRRAVELSGNAPAMLGWLGLILGSGGEEAEARSLLRRLHEMSSEVYLPSTSFAWIHLALGETDKAFEWLDRAVEECDQYLMPIKSYAFLDPLRNDPRFGALLRKMNL